MRRSIRCTVWIVNSASTVKGGVLVLGPVRSEGQNQQTCALKFFSHTNIVAYRPHAQQIWHPTTLLSWALFTHWKESKADYRCRVGSDQNKTSREKSKNRSHAEISLNLIKHVFDFNGQVSEVQYILSLYNFLDTSNYGVSIQNL